MKAPSLEELQRASEIFAEREPRDLFYRVATELVALAWNGKTKISLTEAIAVLLQTWNVSFYRFHGPFDANHFDELETLLTHLRPIMAEYRERDIESLRPNDEPEIEGLFQQAEALLGPVGAAKAFHLLAPRFFPIWDRKIAQAYGCGLGNAGTNGIRYFRFMKITQKQADELRRSGFDASNPLKSLDEYNYCCFTNKWLAT